MKLERGLFLTFEGIDGSGKSTQIEYLEKDIQKTGLDHIFIREPGGSSISEQIREVLLRQRNQEMVAETELLLFAAARAQLVAEVIKPALEQGKIVISDRFYDSTTAYQAYGRQMDLAFIQQLNAYASQGLEPDLTFYLDLKVDSALARLADRSHKTDRIDEAGRDFMTRTRQGYLKIAEENPQRFMVLAADRPADEIYSCLKRSLQSRYNIFN